MIISILNRDAFQILKNPFYFRLHSRFLNDTFNLTNDEKCTLIAVLSESSSKKSPNIGINVSVMAALLHLSVKQTKAALYKLEKLGYIDIIDDFSDEVEG